MLTAKVGDVAPGTCVCATSNPYPATGVVTTGAAQFLTNGVPIALGTASIVMFPCGTSIITATGVTFRTGAMSAAKAGDIVSGCGNGTLTAVSTITSL